MNGDTAICARPCHGDTATRCAVLPLSWLDDVGWRRGFESWARAWWLTTTDDVRSSQSCHAATQVHWQRRHVFSSNQAWFAYWVCSVDQYQLARGRWSPNKVVNRGWGLGVVVIHDVQTGELRSRLICSACCTATRWAMMLGKASSWRCEQWQTPRSYLVWQFLDPFTEQVILLIWIVVELAVCAYLEAVEALLDSIHPLVDRHLALVHFHHDLVHVCLRLNKVNIVIVSTRKPW